MTAPGRLTRLATPAVQGLEAYIPGKPISELQREFNVREPIKLASNENPLGPSLASLAAVREALPDIASYPDGSGFELRAALASHLGVEPDAITLGNGSNDLLVLLAEAFLGPGLEAVYSEYAFLVYRLAVQATGATSRVAPALPRDATGGLGHDLAAMRGRVTAATRVVFVANPNNPTGTWIPAAPLWEFIASLPADVIVVLDEAYAGYVVEPEYPDGVRWLAEFPNLVVARTFSKIHGLAGLRVGYCVSHPEVAEVLNRVRQPFNVNTLGQVAARAALLDGAHVVRSRELNAAGLRQLTAGLNALGWRVTPSVGNFLLVDTGGPAGPWYNALLRSGIIVRPVANYGLPNHLRITVGLEAQNRRLLETLAALRHSGGPA